MRSQVVGFIKGRVRSTWPGLMERNFVGQHFWARGVLCIHGRTGPRTDRGIHQERGSRGHAFGAVEPVAMSCRFFGRLLQTGPNPLPLLGSRCWWMGSARLGRAGARDSAGVQAQGPHRKRTMRGARPADSQHQPTVTHPVISTTLACWPCCVTLSLARKSAYQYNNLMYLVAGMVAERITGPRWEDFTRTRILDPLGMGIRRHGLSPH
jgi:hypothetical protein